MVYNPHSGAGSQAKVAANRCRQLLLAAGVHVETLETEYVGHARSIANSIRPEHQAIMVVAGDGTVHEVINGIHGLDLPLAIVASGTGNGLAATLMQAQLLSGHDEGAGAGPHRRLLAVEEDPVDWAVRQVVRGSVVHIDRLEVSAGRRRFDGAGLVYFGLCAEVDIIAEPLRCLGSLRFDIAAVLQMLKLQEMTPTTIEAVLYDGSTRSLGGPFLAIYIGNLQHWTNKMHAMPTAVLDDGLMELLLIRATCRTDILRCFILLERGAHIHDPQCAGCIEILKVRSASFTFWDAAHTKPLSGVFNVDGEIFQHQGYVRVGCNHQAAAVYAGAVI